jgi:hypothetical protein
MRYALAVLLLLAILSVAACGPGAASATTSAAAPTTVSPTTTAALPTTTASPTTSTTATPTTAAQSDKATITEYAAALQAWNEAFDEWNRADLGTPDDVTKLSDADLQTIRAYVAQGHSFGDQLRAIQPPATMAAVHQRVLDAVDPVLARADRWLAAVEARDQAAYDALGTERVNPWDDFEVATKQWRAVLQLATSTGAPDVRYVSDVEAWLDECGMVWPTDMGRIDIAADVTRLTPADLWVAEKAAADMHYLSDQLHTIKAPAAAAEVHQKLVAAFDALVASVDQELLAMRNKDQAGFGAAITAQDQTTIDSAVDDWGEQWWSLIAPPPS